VVPPPQICAFGDSIFGFDCETPADDNQCLGVEFDGEYFYVTGGGGASHPEPNRVHFFDRDGAYLGYVGQPTTSFWGWRDMAFDGSHMYSSEDGTVAEWFVSGLPGSPVLNVVGSFPGPEDPNRALAYDPESDHFYTANWASEIHEFDRTGTVIGSWLNSYSIYGMAWDDASPDGPWLWVYTQEAPGAIVYQWDPINHVYTGLSIDLTHSGSIAGGAGFTADWDPRFGVLFCMHQSTPDRVIGYEIAPLCEPVEPPEMRSQGYWRRQCKDNLDSHEDICAFLDSVHILSDFFDEFSCDSVCGLMRVDPPERDMCRKARRQFMALLLNVASGKIAVCNCLDDGRTVGDVILEVDSIMLGSPDLAACEYAKTLADGINTGETVVPCGGYVEKALSRASVSASSTVLLGTAGGSMVFKYELLTPQRVRLEIYDKAGRFVRMLVDQEQGPGSREIAWDRRDERGEVAPSGVCFYRLKMGPSVTSGKLILLR
jgi:hypothetical protein